MVSGLMFTSLGSSEVRERIIPHMWGNTELI